MTVVGEKIGRGTSGPVQFWGNHFHVTEREVARFEFPEGTECGVLGIVFANLKINNLIDAVSLQLCFWTNTAVIFSIGTTRGKGVYTLEEGVS